MIKCFICGEILNDRKEISGHFRISHKMSKEIYKIELLKFSPEIFDSCKNCGKKVPKFPNEGGSTSCSEECKKILLVNKNKGRIQKQSTINKRIKNTNQKKKEQTRQKSMLEKYNNLYFCENPEERSEKISKSLTGIPHSEEHHLKVINSKRTNGKLNHSTETKIKIKNSLLEYYQNENIEHSVNIPKIYKSGKGLCGGFKTGFKLGVFYRSSYEKQFLDLCEKFNVKVESAATKEFRVRYTLDNKNHWYYPDFYLPDYDIIVEVKPLSLLTFNENDSKIYEGMRLYSYWLVTEEELFEENSFYEHILSF